MKQFAAILLASVFLLSQIILVAPVQAKETTLNFSPAADSAIHNLAQEILTNGLNPSITAIKPQLDPQDYAIAKEIDLLPDSPFYIFKSVWRGLRLFFTFDQVGRTYQRLQDGNEKTLEAMLLIEKAGKENDAKKHTRLISLSAQALDQVGADFDEVEKTIADLQQKKSPKTAIIQDEAFRFAGQYLKHQILLQRQEDTLNSADFLTIEVARVKHLESLAHIVVASNRDPEVFSEQLVEIVSPQVGSNYSRLSVMALLRDLENNATEDDDRLLQSAQSILRKEVEAKLAKLPKVERLAQVERYSDFIHGNPIRQFQAYGLLSSSFTSEEMKLLTSSFKDQTAQNFKHHLKSLDNEADQQLFAQTLFSNDPIDLRPLIYTEIQLQKKVLGVTTTLAQSNIPTPTTPAQSQSVELERLEKIKTLLGNQMCQIYGQNPESLKQTRFFTRATTQPDVLDLRVAQFLSQVMEKCGSKLPEADGFIAAATTQIEQKYINQAKQAPITKLPTKAEAQEVLEEEQIETTPQDEQKVAEQVAEEIAEIEEEVSVNPTVLEEAVNKIEEEVVTPVEETVTDPITDVIEAEQDIIEDILQSDEPTEDEIIQKEEQIVEEIIDSAEEGIIDPIVEELPEEVQEEIIQEIQETIDPSIAPTSEPTLLPTEDQTIIEEVIETGETTVEPVTEPTTETVTEPTPEPEVVVPAL